MILVALLFFFSIEGLMWFLTKPLAPQLVHQESKDGIIMQSTLSSCVPASAANLLQFYGIKKTEQELAALFGTTLLSGTSTAQLVYGMRSLGINGVMKYLPEADITKIQAPAILVVGSEEKEDHAVALLRQDQKGVELADPLVGRRHLSAAQLKTIWHGRAVEFSRPQH